MAIYVVLTVKLTRFSVLTSQSSPLICCLTVFFARLAGLHTCFLTRRVVNYTIVSQLNPHIHLFWFAPRGSPGKPVAHRKGKGWRGGFLLSAAEQFLKLELTKNFKVR